MDAVILNQMRLDHYRARNLQDIPESPFLPPDDHNNDNTMEVSANNGVPCHGISSGTTDSVETVSCARKDRGEVDPLPVSSSEVPAQDSSLGIVDDCTQPPSISGHGVTSQLSVTPSCATNRDDPIITSTYVVDDSQLHASTQGVQPPITSN